MIDPESYEALEADYQLVVHERDTLTAERDRLVKDLAHWKDCHGVTADALAQAEQRGRAADRLADEVAVLVRGGHLDSRSAAADALLDYREPPYSARSERLVVMEGRLQTLRAALLKEHHPFQHDYVKDEKKCPTCRLLTLTPPPAEEGAGG